MAVQPIISAREVSKAFGIRPLFSEITFAIGAAERIALIGPNGSGKSTLLRILIGLEPPDSGSVLVRNGLRTAFVPQQDVFDDEALTVFETLERALIASGADPHQVHGKISVICGRVGFADTDAPVSTLSGGWRKRLAIARGLVVEPELLVLDEPTNHLDIDGVLWLEELLERLPSALIFVSHDRYFIERVALRVIELNRQFPKGFYSTEGGYSDFLEARIAFLEGLRQTKASLANRVRREVAWLRQGAKARTTKSKYRSAEALRLSAELKKMKLDDEAVDLGFSSTERKTRDLIKFVHLSKSFGEQQLFDDISLTIEPGVRLGVVGPNGSGKTTFVRTVLGEVKPDKGVITHAVNLRFAFFDQAHRQLDRSVTLREALCGDGNSVTFQGKAIHVAGWAERFLFTRDQLELPVRSLSGGEQARVRLAQCMVEETDVLVFDEPTNDLDISTLEVLEESFNQYPGAIVLITHDRYLLDRVATTVLGIGPVAAGLFGDYLQWEQAREEAQTAERRQAREQRAEPVATPAREPKKRIRLGFNEQRELESMEQDIERAEERVLGLQQRVAADDIVADPDALRRCCEELAVEQKKVETLYARWSELEAIKREMN